MKKLTLLLFVFHFSFFTFHLSEAQIIHVPADYPTIQQGIDAANSGDTVLVADGLYYGQISFLGKKPLMVASHYLMTGDTSNISNTIIDGSQLTDMDNASVVYFISGEDTSSILCGFTIRGGYGTHVISSNDRSGGGIYISESGAKIINNKITENTLDDTQPVNGTGVYGGGIGTKRADGEFWLVIENNQIFKNTAKTKNDYSAGAGIYTSYNARITGNVIFENTTTCVSGGWGVGGGMSHLGSGITNTLIISNNKIHHNIAQSSTGVGTDGGVSSQYAHMIFTNNEVYENTGITPSNTGGVGGITLIDPAEGCLVINNIFRGNISTNIGGGIHTQTTTTTENPNLVIISDNYFLDNEADEGGAISDIDIPVILQNNVFKGNHSITRGGALRLYKYGDYSYVHMAILINNSFSGNTAVNFGGAVNSQNAMPLVFNSVFYNDSAGFDGPEIYLNHYLDTLDIANCNIDQGLIDGNIFNGGGNINEDPKFDDPELLTLLADSPCIDFGTQAYICRHGDIHLCPQYDILGITRPQYNAADIGAYEFFGVGVADPSIRSSQFAVRSFPNPTGGIVNLQFTVYNLQAISLKIYDIQGREVAVVLDEKVSAGEHTVKWNAERFPAGIYYYRLAVSGQRSAVNGKLVKY